MSLPNKKNLITEFALYNAYSIMNFFCVEKTLKAFVCQMCGNYSKIQS